MHVGLFTINLNMRQRLASNFQLTTSLEPDNECLRYKEIIRST